MWAIVVEVVPVRLMLFCLVLALFIGTLAFMISTYIKNGSDTDVIIISIIRTYDRKKFI
jgi:hypothetical protein